MYSTWRHAAVTVYVVTLPYILSFSMQVVCRTGLCSGVKYTIKARGSAHDAAYDTVSDTGLYRVSCPEVK